MSGLVQLSVTPARGELQASAEPQVVYLHVVGQTTASVAPQHPLNLCLTLDRSSSMRGERLYHVKEAARHIVNHLGQDDAFALVVFNDWAEVVVPAARGAEASTLQAAISTIEARGGTEMAQGLALGLQEIERPRITGINRLILLTDGRTYGDEQACIELARRAARRGIGITALGVGTEWNEDLLETMTASENSHTQYVASVGEIVPVFEQELQRLRNTVAQRAELVVTSHPQTQLRMLHRVEPFIAPLQSQAIGPGRWRAPLGDWATGGDQQFLIELIMPPTKPGRQTIAKVELRYEPLAPSAVAEAVRTVVELPAVVAPSTQPSPGVQRVLERVSAFRLQAGAWQSAADGRVKEATRRLQQASTHLFNAGQSELAELAKAEATRLLQSGTASAAGRKHIKYGTRGLVAQATKV